jgi:hypothetical protein
VESLCLATDLLRRLPVITFKRRCEPLKLDLQLLRFCLGSLFPQTAPGLTVSLQLLQGPKQLVQGLDVGSRGLCATKLECLGNSALFVRIVRVEEEDMRLPGLSSLMLVGLWSEVEGELEALKAQPQAVQDSIGWEEDQHTLRNRVSSPFFMRFSTS